jgi:hypothetical protein
MWGLLIGGLLLSLAAGPAFTQDVVDVEIEPSAVTVPQGSCFNFSVSFTVPHHDAETFLVSAFVETPWGAFINLMDDRELTVPPHSTLTFDPRLCVPRRAPVGDYILTVEAHDFDGTLLDSDSLIVTVEHGSGLVEDWELRDF